MILKLCGGEPSKAKVAGKEPIENRVIAFDFARVAKLTGVKLSDEEISKTLEALGFKIDGKPNAAKVSVPTWRPDIHGAADLVEEVVRIAGLDRVPATPLAARAWHHARRTDRKAEARAAHPPSARCPRLRRGGDLELHPEGPGDALRRRRGGARSCQPDLDGNVVDAARTSARPADGRHPQPQSRLRGRRAVRTRPSLPRRETGRSVSERRRRARRHRTDRWRRPPLGRQG